MTTINLKHYIFWVPEICLPGTSWNFAQIQWIQLWEQIKMYHSVYKRIWLGRLSSSSSNSCKVLSISLELRLTTFFHHSLLLATPPWAVRLHIPWLSAESVEGINVKSEAAEPGWHYLWCRTGSKLNTGSRTMGTSSLSLCLECGADSSSCCRSDPFS